MRIAMETASGKVMLTARKRGKEGEGVQRKRVGMRKQWCEGSFTTELIFCCSWFMVPSLWFRLLLYCLPRYFSLSLFVCFSLEPKANVRSCHVKKRIQFDQMWSKSLLFWTLFLFQGSKSNFQGEMGPLLVNDKCKQIGSFYKINQAFMNIYSIYPYV